jgi:hypothetical protein
MPEMGAVRLIARQSRGWIFLGIGSNCPLGVMCICWVSMTTSGSIQIAELVGRCIAGSRTVWNNTTWTLSLRENLREDVETEGQILIKQKQDFAEGRAHTFVAEDADVGSVLDIIVGQSNIENLRALIDTGGIFQASNGQAVSRKMPA